MNNKNYICSIVLLACITFRSFAQTQRDSTLPIAEKQLMMLKVVDLFNDYEKFCAIDEDFSKYVSPFRELFVNTEVPVYNDLIGIAYDTLLTAKDYAKLMSENSTATRTSISNLACQPLYFENGVWKMKCTFEKKINLTNKCGIEFASDFFNGSDYHLSAIIVFNPQTSIWQFEKIDGTTEVKRQLVKGYRVVMKNSAKDNKVHYNNKPLEFNEMGQAFVSPNGQFIYPQDLDVLVKEIIDDEQCNLIHLKYGIKPWRIKAHYDIGLGKALTVANNLFYDDISSKSSSFGIDAGYIFPSKGKIKIGVFMGLGISGTSLDLSFKTDKYSFDAKPNQDVDGDTYERVYENVSFSQKTQIRELSIPVYGNLDWRFSRWVSMFLDLGLKLNMNFSSSVDDFVGSVENVHGIYPQYDNLLLDYHWGNNGFTKELNLTKDNLCDGESLSIKKFAPDLLLGVGFRFNIPRTPLAVDVGLGYQKGIGDMISISENINASQNNGKMIYNEILSGNSSEHIHDLVESAGSISRNNLKFNLGLIYKF